MMAGLQMLMASRSGPGQAAPGLMQILAGGALTGQQTGQAARGQMQMGQAMQNPAMGLSERQRAILAALPPEQQQAILAQLATAGGGEPKVVGDGAALVGPDGNLLYENAPADGGMKMSTNMPAILASMGIPPGTPMDQIPPDVWAAALEEEAKLRRAGATSVTNNVGATEKAFDQAINTQFQNVSADMTTAEDMMDRLDMMDQLIDSGMDTGALENLTMPLRGIGASLGLADADNLGRQQVFQGLANRIALMLRGTSMPGPMSDKDIQFLVNQAPALANTVEGNKLLIELLRRTSQKQIDMAVEMSEYLSSGKDSRGWFAHRARWMRDNRIDLSDLVQRAERVVQQEAPF